MPSNIFPKNKKITRIALIILAVLILSIIGVFIYRQFIFQSPAQAEEETLQTTTAKRGDLELYASGTGSYIAASTASIGFDTGGQIVELNAVVGEMVEEGQVLARLKSTSAQTAYDQALRVLRNLTSTASIATAKDAVATAESDLESAQQSLMYIISPTVYSYEQKVKSSEQALTDAKKESESNPSAENTEKVAVAQTTLEKAQKNLTSSWYWYEKTYVPEMFTVEERTPGSKKTTKYVAAPSESDIESTRAQLILAEATLQEAKDYLAALNGEEISNNATGTALNEFEQAKLDVQTALETIESLTLSAPISGMVTAVDADLGDTVSTGTIITISNINDVVIEFYLDETDFDKVSVGYPVEVVFDSLPDLILTGKVTSVDPSLSEQNGSKLVKGKATLDALSPATQGKLLLGMNASVDVIGGTATNAVIISVDALHEIDTDQYGVYILKNGKLTFSLVEVGLNDSFNVEIKSGLQPGDVVSTGLLETN